MDITHPQTSMQSLWQLKRREEEDGGDGDGGGKWAGRLLRESAAAISEKDSGRIHHLLWMVNELASPYGDREQKLAAYFLQALFCRATDSGGRCLRTLTAAADRMRSFESTRRVMLRFQELTPWSTFGHVASNGAILEAMDGETRLHVVDLSCTYCTQWPTLLETLASRSDQPPHLRLTVVNPSDGGGVGGVDPVVSEIGRRMEKFARLMGVPFEFHAVAVNCMGALRRVVVDQREAFQGLLRDLHPKVVTVVEEEADFSSTRDDFLRCFDECWRFYSLFFEILEESFPPTSQERLLLERECSKGIVGALAGGDGGGGRRETAALWCERLRKGFSPVGFSGDRYPAGWSISPAAGAAAAAPGLFLAWKGHPVVWASAWRP
ncbi:unnamed protein product [Spirodela intermedia]|uniref:Uncharacterized protein n=1 Tax=Spirodela intermedia TaxID=51605 RepID=A0A7I8J3F9_SPIIN|nr:unnamed protein product [Spirodela intermedia]CAA6663880.1 unnamed protein product [Spirodela intermedia]